MISRTGLLAAAFVGGALVAGSAQAVLIDFESFSNADSVGTVGNATFTSSGGVQVYAIASYAHSGVNTIAPDIAGGGYNGNLYVDFALPVDNLSFWSGGDNDVVGASINIFVNSVLADTVDLISDADGFGVPDLHDLGAYSHITRIEIFNVTDRNGLVYDDFSFDLSQVPSPGSLPLLASGLGGMGLFARSRKRKTAN